ncbi:MAG: glycoside hydrolase family 95 protein, partial [Chitinophagaceae bacterium]|nr:glycoside hydrolase family 95 protein [Chitinophagaceae bacterium]
MKIKCLFIVVVFFATKAHTQSNMKLWYAQPAKDWNEALPIGNGSLGAIIFGRPSEELIQLNEQTLWTGGPANLNPNPDAPKYLQPVRDAIFKDSISQAVKLLRKMQGSNVQMYQPLGDIIIKQQYIGQPSAYTRNLNISNATSTTKFSVDGVDYTREIFATAPDKSIIIRLASSKKNALNFSVDVRHELQYQKLVTPNKELVLKGKARINNDERRNPKPFIYEDAEHKFGMRFQFRIK